ncbi:MAG: ribonuclease, partial [Thermoleophilaceae bacterium]|nr:ribonuclease [Thermoleophilaceae bacterium]
RKLPAHARGRLSALKVTVHVDGGSSGNPGPAAAAAVASDESGNPLAERNRYIGETTNNVAEYEGVLLALELARELGASEVEVVNDSELVARQIGGQYRVKQEHLKPLHRQVMDALRGFDGWEVRSVRREHNVRADELVNEALDEAASR